MNNNSLFNKTIKIVLGLITIIGLVIGGFTWYNSRLEQSKSEGQNIPSRAVKVESSPSITSTNPSSNIASQAQPKLLKSGKFNTIDPVHYAKGGVEIVEKDSSTIQVVISDDFATNPDGPDLYFWLVKKQDIKNIAVGGLSTNKVDYLDLGAVQSKSGKQIYQITKSEFEGNDYAVVIWCRAFGVQFSNAILN
jgi:hypothetical protein